MGEGCRDGKRKEAGRYSGAEAWLDGSRGEGGDQLRIINCRSVRGARSLEVLGTSL